MILDPGAGRLEIEPRSFAIDPATVEARKELLGRVWRYEPVDHIPIQVDLSPACGVTVRESQLEREAWFTSAVRRIEWSLELLPDDYIPLAEPPWLGFYTVPKMLGAQLWWSDDLNAFPGVRQPLVTTIEELTELRAGDPRCDGVLPEALARPHRICRARRRATTAVAAPGARRTPPGRRGRAA